MNEPEVIGEGRIRLSVGGHDAPLTYDVLADELNSTQDQHVVKVGMAGGENLPIVVGEVGPDGKVRVNEAELEPGRYRVRAGVDGEIVGEIRVTDPRMYLKENRADRRRKGRGTSARFRPRDFKYGVK